MSRSLDGIKIVEMATHVAVPMATRLLADWGAEVIKVEAPQGDPYRVYGHGFGLPFEEDHNVIFQPYNINKKSICIDIKKQDGVDALFKLLETADVFAVNTRMKSLEKLGLTYDTLKEKFPKLIMAHVSGYGEDGPDKDAPGFDAAAFWARSGVLLEWKDKDSVPFKPFFGYGDCTVSMALTAGILNALFNRERTGHGEFVRTSLFGCGIWYNNAGVIMSQPQFGHIYPKSRYSQSDPLMNSYLTKDGDWVMVADSFYDKNYPLYFNLLGLNEHLDDPRWNSLAGAREHMEEVVRAFEEGFLKVSTEEALALFEAHDIVNQRLRNPAEVYKDEQAWANEYVREMTFPSGDTMVLPNNPIKFSEIEKPDFCAAPYLGGDSDRILKDLGYTEEKIKELYENKAIIQNPKGV